MADRCGVGGVACRQGREAKLLKLVSGGGERRTRVRN